MPKKFHSQAFSRYVIIKFSYYGMGKMKSSSTVSTTDNIMKLVYFTFLLPYGLLSFIRMSLKFQDENSFYRGKACLMTR